MNRILKLMIILSLGILVTAAGHLSTFIAGRSVGYMPEIVPLMRNILIMIMLFTTGVYVFSRGYLGDIVVFICMFYLMGIGLSVQYGIESRNNKSDRLENFVSMETVLDESSINRINVSGISSTGKDNDLSAGRLVKIFLENHQEWQKFIIQFSFACIVFIFIIMNVSRDPDILISRYYLWAAVILFSFAMFTLFSTPGKFGGRFFYDMTPWEIYKIMFVVVIAGFLSENRDAFRGTGKKIPVPPLIAIGPLIVLFFLPLAFLFFLKDIGQLFLYAAFLMIMVYAVTKRISYILISLFVISLAVILILNFGEHLPGSFAHISRRIAVFWNFWDGFPEGLTSLARAEEIPEYVVWRRQSWQILNGYFAINAGGVTGTGIGFGMPTLIPLVSNDFVYTALAEEWGIIGCAFVLAFYLLIVQSGIKIAANAENDFIKYLAFGFSAMFAIQVVLNIAGVINLIPMTGVTLPFLSKGGFSLMTNMWIIGFQMAISHYINIKGNHKLRQRKI